MLPSTSLMCEPLPESMKMGSRPIERIALTGELTPPGITRCARPYRALDAGVLAFPVAVVIREVQKADLLELGRGVERGALGDAGLLGDRLEDRVAFLLRA